MSSAARQRPCRAAVNKSQHSSYADRVVVCRGVFQEGAEVPVYAILVGICGEIMHNSVPPGKGESPGANVELTVNPAAGFTKGFLHLTVATRK